MPKKGAEDAMKPGISLKFLRDGMASANTVAMYSPLGQPDQWNFFEHEFYNHVPSVKNTKIAAVLYKSSGVTDWVYAVGSSDIAQYTESGYKIDNPVFPFKLDFVPNPTIKSMFSNDFKGYMNYLDQLKAVPAGSVLYKVYGWTAPP